MSSLLSNSEALYTSLFPTAAFSPSPHDKTKVTDNCESCSWDVSSLNPKNRIDSLDLPVTPRWRISGCAGLGTQLYAIPLFLEHTVPLRIDVFIPPPSHIPAPLHEILDLGIAFRYRDSRFAGLGIARHVVRTLEYWTNVQVEEDLKSKYASLPFGSRLILDNIVPDVTKIRIEIAPAHQLERQLLSLQSLQSFWKHIPPESWPETLDISELHILDQLHDSISLVSRRCPPNDEKFIFKSVTNEPKFMYHELKLLLSMPAHPNIITAPLHLVTKKCLFGGKVAVAGFTIPYHPLGSLRDILPHRRMNGTLRLQDQLKWAQQVVSGLQHLKNEAREIYPDLRLDNILLTSPPEDVLLIDFEQRGVGFVFAAPEVNYYKHIMDLQNGSSHESSSAIPPLLRGRYRRLYEAHISPYVLPERDVYGAADTKGFCVPWLCMTPAEQEDAQVYLLGLLLWCIFEGYSIPERSLTTAVRNEEFHGLGYPNFTHRTPDVMKTLILECTKGWKETVFGVIRRFERSDDVEGLVRQWWLSELEDVEKYLDEKEERRRRGETRYSRPKLEEVSNMLESLEKDLFLT